MNEKDKDFNVIDAACESILIDALNSQSNELIGVNVRPTVPKDLYSNCQKFCTETGSEELFDKLFNALITYIFVAGLNTRAAELVEKYGSVKLEDIN